MSRGSLTACAGVHVAIQGCHVDRRQRNVQALRTRAGGGGVAVFGVAAAVGLAGARVLVAGAAAGHAHGVFEFQVLVHCLVLPFQVLLGLLVLPADVHRGLIHTIALQLELDQLDRLCAPSPSNAVKIPVDKERGCRGQPLSISSRLCP
eukprot:scaffold182_cov350-Prasinococcus_capsulatus_cf.AAC.14